MAITKGLFEKAKAILEDETYLLCFLTEEECGSLVEILKKKVEVEQTTATE